MRNMVLAALGLVAVILSSASKGEEPAARADPPVEVQALIDRNAYCNSLATDPEPNSVAQLDAQRLYFKCDALTKDVALLRERYQNDPRIVEALDLAELPADADDLSHTRAGCDKWAAELHAHQDRAAGIEATRAYLKCDAVANDEAALRQKYIGNPAILKALDGKWVIIFKRECHSRSPRKRIRRIGRRVHPISSIADAFRDTNIAFANELSMICDRLGINMWDLIALANRHPRVTAVLGRRTHPRLLSVRHSIKPSLQTSRRRENQKSLDPKKLEFIDATLTPRHGRCERG